MTHSERINRVIEFIEANFDSDISLDLLARKSALSRYHFHRIFRALTGDPPFKYIEKRRLSKAAHELIHTDRRIVDIAFEYGFNSHESFTRAFKKRYLKTPSLFRKTASAFDYYNKCRIGALDLILQSGEVRIKPTIRRLPSFRMAGLNYTGHDARAIYALWEKFWQTVAKARNKTDITTCFGACFHDIDMRNKEIFDYYAGIKVDQFSAVPPKLKAIQIPANIYAVFTHRGPISEIEHTYDRIYGHWLPGSRYTPTVDLDIIQVDQRFDGQGEENQVDIFIPIRE